MTEPVAQNYYPVNAKILIKDDISQLGVLSDRSQAGSSLQDGCVELMVHRRLLDDDAFGVGEALNEQAFGTGLVAVGKHIILMNNDEEAFNEDHVVKAMELFYEPMTIFGELDQGVNFPRSPQLSEALPKNVHILTLRKIDYVNDPFGKYLFLQLEHIFESNQHSILSQSVTVDLETMFNSASIAVESYKETNLAGNVWKDKVSRLRFNKDSNEIPRFDDYQEMSSQWVITLSPMDIRSFIIKYN